MYRFTTPRVFKKDESEWGMTEDNFMRIMSILAARGKIESFIIITPYMCPSCRNGRPGAFLTLATSL